MASKKVVVVEGLIGGGKTSISRELAAALGPDTLLLLEPDEKDEANPYLADFYGDQPRWALTMQLHLLQSRYRMCLHAQWHAMQGHGHAVIDRSISGDTSFARLQVKTGAMSQREYETYCSVYQAMTATVLHPSVCVRLLVSPEVAQRRIQLRMEAQTGRKCENVIDLGYLTSLDEEISHMVGVLQSRGVTVLSVPWDVDRDTSEARASTVQGLASTIKNLRPTDLLLDLHSRRV